jgi:hypothetical protein
MSDNRLIIGGNSNMEVFTKYLEGISNIDHRGRTEEIFVMGR